MTVTTQIDAVLHELLTNHCAARRCSKSQVIKDQLVALLIPVHVPTPALPALPELRRRPTPGILTVDQAKRQAKGGLK